MEENKQITVEEITLRKIKDDHANRLGFTDYNQMANRVLDLNDPINDEIAEEYATLKTQQLTAENERLREAQRWIPVTERLPEGECEVLVCINEMYTGTAKYEYFDNCGWLFTNDSYDNFYSGDVTHWIPLPNKPELT